jgi:hypothetical protein
MLPTPHLTLHPLAELQRRYRPISKDEIEAEMTTEEGKEVATGPMPMRDALWWEVKNYASAMYLTHHTNEALLFAQRAVRMRRCVSTLVTLSVIQDELGKYEEALQTAREAATCDAGDDRATARLGELLLRSGKLSEGWSLYIRNRASMDWCKPFLPEWEGPHQEVQSKRFLVIEGGGYGDNLYFLRWLHTLRRWGADIHYICQPSFAPLVRQQKFRAAENWQGNVDVHWDDYDYYLPLLSIAGKMGVTLENYRWNGPYIQSALRRPWRKTRRIGLCFRAGEAKSPRKQRSLHNEQIQRLIEAVPKSHTCVNMTHGMWHPDIDGMLEGDWLNTANVMSTLDLLVTVDTGVAHLAGSMGVPCWVILPGASAWHYPLGYKFHPLYPSMEILRNPEEGLEVAVTKAEERLIRL